MTGVMLAIETSTTDGSVALGAVGSVLGETVLGPDTRQSEALLPAIDGLLAHHQIDRRAIAAIVVGGGPGSFTGLRIAAATAKGFARALDAPLYAYSGLLAAAYPFASEGVVCALFDARRDEVYAACLAFGATLVYEVEPAALTIHEVLSRVSAAEVRFVGEGAVKHGDLIERNGGTVKPSAPRASALLALAARYPEIGRVPDPGRWVPNYLRASGAERGVSG